MSKDKPKRRWPAKDTDEYCEKRSQNNVAVKRSREKARIKQTETKQRVDGLKVENSALELKVETLKKELSVLKDVFTSHASGAAAAIKADPPEPVITREQMASEDPVLLDHVYSNTKNTSRSTKPPS